MARRHLAVFLRGAAEKILSREKQVEVRLSESRILPYGAVAKDDEIYLKNSGGKIIGKAFVDNCLYYDRLNENRIEEIRKKYSNPAGLDKSFWERKSNAHFATIIFLKNPQKFLTPVVFHKRDRRAWVIMEEKCL